MTRIIPAGRTDLNDFFTQSGVFHGEPLIHTPLLVFVATQDAVEVRILHMPSELLAFPDETPVMGQWRGEWRSDYFQFTVGQYRQHTESQLNRLKAAHNVRQGIGPKGGVRSLRYEYVDEHGTSRYEVVSSKAEIDRLTKFFRTEGIPIQIDMVR